MIEFFMIGNVGSDAVVNTANSKPVINFQLCHSEPTKRRLNSEGNKKYWVDCAYFVDNPELVKLLAKGTQVYVKGKPDVKVHVPKGGDPVAVQYLIVSKVEILSARRKEPTLTT